MKAAVALKVRVWVPEVWDVVDLATAPDATVGQLKVLALAQATGRACEVAPCRHGRKPSGWRREHSRKTLFLLYTA